MDERKIIREFGGWSSNILGVLVDSLTVDQLHLLMADTIRSQQKRLVLNVNIHCLNLAYTNQWLRDFLNRGEIVFCDGAGVRLGGKILGFQIPPRITYADWTWQLGEFCEAEEFTLYFLGAKPGIAEKAAEKLKSRFPKLKIAGIHHGYFDKTLDNPENISVIKEINKVKPDILLVCFGMPMQEKWLMENWPQIDVNIALPGGATFDYISGELQRAPKWMTDSGMEWLGRLLIEPKRLWRRYVIGNPVFFLRIFLQKLGWLFLDQK
jgi:N-acetylglucosaminyldiphosphoundecaprenol N-acetyl-beta-D-mannosaminyltransferase